MELPTAAGLVSRNVQQMAFKPSTVMTLKTRWTNTRLDLLTSMAGTLKLATVPNKPFRGPSALEVFYQMNEFPSTRSAG